MSLRRLGNGEFEFFIKVEYHWWYWCECNLDATGETIPFTARSDDTETGVELFNMLSTTYSAQVAAVDPQEQYDD